MDNSQFDFSSKLSARAVTAGTIATVALMIMFMTLAGGMGLWSFDLSDLSRLGPAFWIWSFAAWSVSVYASSYVAAYAAKCDSDRDGALHGFVIWAISCAMGFAFFALRKNGYFTGLPENVSSPMLFAVFMGELVALSAAVYGGIRGAAVTEQTKVRLLETVFGN